MRRHFSFLESNNLSLNHYFYKYTYNNLFSLAHVFDTRLSQLNKLNK